MAIKPYEVTTSKIATKAVTSEKIADRAIETKHIQDGAVTPAKLSITLAGRPLSPGIETTEIKDGVVTTAKIAGNAVTNEKIAPNSVNADKITDGAITTAKIANGAITRDKVADRSVGTADLVDGAVTSAKLATSSVTQSKIAADSVGASELRDGAVTSRELSSAAVTPPKVEAVNAPADGQVLSYEGASGRFKYVTPVGGITRPLTPPIETAEIGDGQVTTPKIADLQITDSKLQDGAVTTPKVGDLQITTGKIADLQISDSKIANNAVTNAKLQDASITPPKVDAVNTPTDGQVLSYELATSRFKYVTPAAGASGITLLNSNITVYSNSDLLDVDQVLDLSAWIPATATGVLVEMQHTGATTDGNDRILLVFGRRTAMDHGYSTLPLQGRYQDLYKDAIVATDSARMIRVFISRGGRFSAVNVWVKGYIE